ncbi:D-serine ammonia-lyase [Ottowia thiooxydans]|uniref:Probable D-serine dehydratase n=1 Tax=Ottowia thiooxydans TaxID=219182 RepID=A0ABV2QBD0_9BURK
MQTTTHEPDRFSMPASQLESLSKREPILWVNPNYAPLALVDVQSLEPAQALERFKRHAPVLRRVFAELEASAGQVSSALEPANALADVLAGAFGPCSRQASLLEPARGNWWIKRDDALPVAGSVKARGGFHEVLSVAEDLLASHGVQCELDSSEASRIFSQYTVAVGSTGNLGLSIGLIAARLGFRAVVHMSSDAKAWKKQRLRSHGIQVVEHEGDYAAAVAAGRAQSEGDPFSHFVDDEHSVALFLGYSAAADELAVQLDAHGVVVDEAHPLFVYIPCGVGGAPGGIAYGLKQRYGRAVHCFFAEPVASPCMLLQLASAPGQEVSVYDIGLDNRTEADGLAVPSASPLVAPLMREMLSGIFTVDDETLFLDTYLLHQSMGLLVEPSAAASFRGPLWLQGSEEGKFYQKQNGLERVMDQANHVLWSTGGSLVPESEHLKFQERGRALRAPHPQASKNGPR